MCMVDPYKMVAINTIASIVILFGILFFKICYPKRSINLFVLLVLISLLPTISMLRDGAYESGDFNIHIYRTISFYQSLSEGNLMPSWAGDLNATYGYPLFIFNYPLPYYLVSFFHFLGFTFITSMKLFLASNLIVSGIFMYLFSKTITKNNLAAFTSAIFYIFAPYYLIDVHFKIVIGEVLFFTLLPLSFLLMYKLYDKKTIILLFLSALSIAGLIMSHAAVGVFAVVLMLSYLFFLSWQNKFCNKPVLNILALVIAGVISLYAWFGPSFLSQYSFIQKIKLTTVYFPTLADLLFSPWRFGFLFQGPKGEISHLIGYVHIFVILAFLFIISRKKQNKYRPHYIFWTSIIFISIFFVLPYSKFIWENLSYLKVVGSQRLLIIVAFAISILAGYFVIVIKKPWIIYALVVATIGITILNWGHRKVIPTIDDNFLKSNLWKSTSQGEAHFYANTKWVDVKKPWFSVLPKNHAEIISGNGEIKNIFRTSTNHKYSITAKTPLEIQENTLYFPGWKGFVNGIETSLSPSNRGVIQTTIPKGSSTLEITYQDIFTYKLLKIISIATLSFVLILLLMQFKIKPKH